MSGQPHDMAPNHSKPAAAPSTYSSLDAVDENLASQNIVVRLLRTWEARDFKRNNALLSVDCLLLDEKGTVIQASIHPRRLHKYREKLKEGNLFSISDFDVRKSPNKYRLTDHAFKINFNDLTTMENVEDGDHQIPHTHFRICPFKEVQMLADKGANLPDVVAQISSTRTFHKLDETKSPSKKTFNLTLTCTFDSGESAYISLWEKHASQVHDEIEELKKAPIVVIVTGVNPKSVGGQLYLNATASTRLFFNLDSPIIKEFCNSTYYEEGLLPTTVDGNVVTPPTETHSIAQILDFVNDQGGMAKTFWCKAKVVDVILTSGWFFILCSTCRKKMIKTGQNLFCEKCRTVQTVGVLRFRIEVIVDDGFQTATFVIFDEPAIELFKTTASDLAAKEDASDRDNSGDIVPQVIQDIVGKDFIFLAKVSVYNYTAKYQSFSVSEIFIPPIATKKRTQTSESCSRKKSNNNKVIKTIDSECYAPEKQPTNRKNKAQVVMDESDEETLTKPCSDAELDDDI